jgi:hypothetical protein
MSSIVIAGDTSGSVTLQAPAVSGSTILTLPATSGTVQTSGAGFTTNGVAYASSTSALTTGSALTWDGSLFTVAHASGVDGRGIRLFNSSNSQTWETRIGVQALENTAYAIKDITANAVSLLIQAGTGNVGIGTTSPAQKLHVLSSSTTATVAKFAATNYGNLGTTYIEIGTQFGDGCSRIGSINPVNNQSILVFETMTGTSGVYAERARIENNGNLFVGTTSQIGSTASRQVIKFDNNNFYGLALGGSASGAAGMLNFYNSAGTEQGYISTTGSGSTSYVTSSDYRLKENIAPMTGALAKVAQLKPVTYTWKEDGSSGQGFIAHELQAIVPDCVTREKDAVDADGNPKYQGVDTSFLVATLTAAIQEQQAIIELLKARLDAANL